MDFGQAPFVQEKQSKMEQTQVISSNFRKVRGSFKLKLGHEGIVKGKSLNYWNETIVSAENRMDYMKESGAKKLT